jgi:hypothetical protein
MNPQFMAFIHKAQNTPGMTKEEIMQQMRDIPRWVSHVSNPDEQQPADKPET